MLAFDMKLQGSFISPPDPTPKKQNRICKTDPAIYNLCISLCALCALCPFAA
jgi:hypothetical protein